MVKTKTKLTALAQGSVIDLMWMTDLSSGFHWKMEKLLLVIVNVLPWHAINLLKTVQLKSNYTYPMHSSSIVLLGYTVVAACLSCTHSWKQAAFRSVLVKNTWLVLVSSRSWHRRLPVPPRLKGEPRNRIQRRARLQIIQGCIGLSMTYERARLDMSLLQVRDLHETFIVVALGNLLQTYSKSNLSSQDSIPLFWTF